MFVSRFEGKLTKFFQKCQEFPRQFYFDFIQEIRGHSIPPLWSRKKKKKKKKTSHANNGLDSLDPPSLLINETERLPSDIYAKGEFFRND